MQRINTFLDTWMVERRHHHHRQVELKVGIFMGISSAESKTTLGPHSSCAASLLESLSKWNVEYN